MDSFSHSILDRRQAELTRSRWCFFTLLLVLSPVFPKFTYFHSSCRGFERNPLHHDDFTAGSWTSVSRRYRGVVI